MSDDIVDKFSSWVCSGGKFIGIGVVLLLFIGKSGFGLSYKSNISDNGFIVLYQDYSYVGVECCSIVDVIFGVIFSVDMDVMYLFVYGFDFIYFLLKISIFVFVLLESGWNVGQIGDEFYIIGFVGSCVKEKMKNILVYGV